MTADHTTSGILRRFTAQDPGRLIPAGTGTPAYRDIYMKKEEPAPAPTLEELLRPEDEQ